MDLTLTGLNYGERKEFSLCGDVNFGEEGSWCPCWSWAWCVPCTEVGFIDPGELVSVGSSFFLGCS